MKQPNMNITLEYKGYVGSVEFSEQDRIFYGKVKGIHSLISYEGTTINELTKDFHEGPCQPNCVNIPKEFTNPIHHSRANRAYRG